MEDSRVKSLRFTVIQISVYDVTSIFAHTLSRSKLFSSLNDSRWLTEGCTAADNSSVSVRPCSIKSLHPSPEHRTRCSLQVSCCSYIFLIPDEKVLKKTNDRCNRNWFPSQSVRIHSTSFLFTKTVAYYSRCIFRYGYSRFVHTHTHTHTHKQHSRMETFNYSIAWQCTIM